MHIIHNMGNPGSHRSVFEYSNSNIWKLGALFSVWLEMAWRLRIVTKASEPSDLVKQMET